MKELTLAIAAAALAVSISTFFVGRRRDKRDLLLALHDRLTTADQQRGRRLVYLMSDDGKGVADLSREEYDLINNALAFLNTVGIYYEKDWVPRGVLLEIWGDPVLRIMGPAEPFLAYRGALPGGFMWPHLHVLAAAAREHVRKQGRDPVAVAASRNVPAPRQP